MIGFLNVWFVDLFISCWPGDWMVVGWRMCGSLGGWLDHARLHQLLSATPSRYQTLWHSSQLIASVLPFTSAQDVILPMFLYHQACMYTMASNRKEETTSLGPVALVLLISLLLLDVR